MTESSPIWTPPTHQPPGYERQQDEETTGPADDSIDYLPEEAECCPCTRDNFGEILLRSYALLAIPVLVAISLAFFVLWLVFLPVAAFCPCCEIFTKAVNKAWKYFSEIPVHITDWVCRAGAAKVRHEQEQGQDAELGRVNEGASTVDKGDTTLANYGATDSKYMGDAETDAEKNTDAAELRTDKDTAKLIID